MKKNSIGVTVFYDLLKHSILLKLYCHVVQLSHETCTCDKTMEGIQLVLSHFQILQYCYGSWKGPGCNLKIALSVLELSAAVLSYHGCIPNMTSGYLMETLQPPSKFLHLGNTFFLFCGFIPFIWHNKPQEEIYVPLTIQTIFKLGASGWSSNPHLKSLPIKGWYWGLERQ